MLQRDTPLVGVCDEHQVISMEKLPGHTNAKLSRKCLQLQNGQQWAKGRTLMHTVSHASL